ncbi:MAG: triose-phosphate isomerase [Bacteroides sp.]|nr:triose-phosphate isomerase [Bacteroides sp.]
MENKTTHTILLIWTNLCRFVLAGLFLFSGFVKAVDPLGFTYKIQDYLVAFGVAEWFPFFFPLCVAIFVSAIEFCIGVFLFFGIRKHLAVTLALLLMLFMTPLTLYLALANPVSDCGCFGDAWILTNWQTFWKNVGLLIAAVTLFRWRKLLVRFISRQSEWLVSMYTLIFIFFLSFYCLRYLPILDFRPYRIGTDIRQAMAIPEGAQPAVIETVFILEKEGKRQEFTLEDYPYEDNSWQFVDRKDVVLEKGYEPPIHDFSLTETQTGEDITDLVLTDPGYSFLLVIHRVELADDSRIDLINEIYDYSQEHGYGFYALTSSPDEEIESWRDRTGAEYLFCRVDDITLKTIIRANPGLLLIRDGVVLRKWSNARIPDEYVLHDKLENLELGQLEVPKDASIIGKVFLWFVIPLLMVLAVDFFFIKRRSSEKEEDTYHINPLITNKMRKNIVAGNWKMNKTLQEGIELATSLNEALAGETPKCDVVICTPFIHLASVAPVVDAEKIGVGAENCADKEAGAYTGEVSAAMVASTGARYVILGHSERRAYYGETVEILREKVKLALANGLTPIFCIGEVLEEREAGKQNEVVFEQLASVYSLSPEDFSKIVLAYEPVWAIGTGKTATSAQAQEIHAYIRSTIAEKYGQEIADQTSILYGGSCNASNAAELFANPDVDGGLIGGASLKVADFKAIIDAF